MEAVKSFYDGCEACVRVENEESELFRVNVGLRRVCNVTMAVELIHGWGNEGIGL